MAIFCACAFVAIWWTATAALDALTVPVEPFDYGITAGSVLGMTHGLLPQIDFYSPYGLLIGAPGALLHVVGIEGIVPERFVYGLGRPLCAVLATVFLWRRHGWRAGVLAAILIAPEGVGRYDYPYALLFGTLLIIDGASRRAPQPTLTAIATHHPRRLALAIALLSLTGWIRMEYAVLPLLFGVVLLTFLRGRARWLWASAAVVAAGLPSLFIVANGSGEHLLWWLHYALGGDLEATRGQPILWRDLRLGTTEARLAVAAYGIGALSVIAALIAACTSRGRAWFRADATGIRMFAVLVCGVILRAQLLRYSAAYAAIGVPVLLLPALLWLGDRVQRLSTLSAAALAAVVLIVTGPIWARPGAIGAYRDYRALDDDHRAQRRDAVAGMDRAPLGPEQWRPWAAAQSEWRRLGLNGRRTTVVNRDNHLTWVDPLIYNRVLDAPQATWLWVYDPGMANQQRVQRLAARQLCANQAPVLQSVSDATSLPPTDAPAAAWRSGSTYLDEFLALSYRLSSQPYDRILMFASCALPEKTGPSTAARVRDHALASGDLKTAAAAARVHARKTRGRDPLDATLMLAAGVPVKRTWVPTSGPLAAAARSFAAGRPDAGVDRALREPALSANERALLAHAAVVGRDPKRPVAPSTVRAVQRAATERPNDLTVGDLRGIQPFAPSLWQALVRETGHASPAMDRWWVEGALGSAQPQLAVQRWTALERALRAQGRLLELGDLATQLGTALLPVDAGCGTTLLRIADALPGTHIIPPPAPTTSCATLGGPSAGGPGARDRGPAR